MVIFMEDVNILFEEMIININKAVDILDNVEIE
jgi:hypothetical protein